MVYLAVEPRAACEAIQVARKTGSPVWVGSDAITSEEHKRLVQEGVSVTRFSTPMANATPEVIDAALATIKEHHPSEIIFVQHIPPESGS
jgi:hypothetical protein